MAISVVVLGTEPSVFPCCVFFVFLCAGGFTGACSYCFLFILPLNYFEFSVPGFAFVWCFEFCCPGLYSQFRDFRALAIISNFLCSL